VTLRRSAEAVIYERGAEPAVMMPLVTLVLSNLLRSLCSDTWAHTSYPGQTKAVMFLHYTVSQYQTGATGYLRRCNLIRSYTVTLKVVTVTVGLEHGTPWSESASELYRPSDAACRRSDCQLLRTEGATWSA
jgi:hypothetical protein